MITKLGGGFGRGIECTRKSNFYSREIITHPSGESNAASGADRRERAQHGRDGELGGLQDCESFFGRCRTDHRIAAVLQILDQDVAGDDLTVDEQEGFLGRRPGTLTHRIYPARDRSFSSG